METVVVHEINAAAVQLSDFTVLHHVQMTVDDVKKLHRLVPVNARVASPARLVLQIDFCGIIIVELYYFVLVFH